MNRNIDETPEVIALANERRRRALRRGIASVLAVFLALIALRVWWGYEAHRRLQAEIDRIHAAGEPILVEDFYPIEDVPDEQNAALLYQQATAALDKTGTDRITFSDLIRYHHRVCAAYPDDARAILQANKSALDLIRRARDLPKVDWGVRPVSPLINLTLPMLSSQRELCKLVRTAAVFEHQEGYHAESIETILNMNAITCKLGAGETSFLITHLVALGTDAVLALTLEAIAPTLVVERPGSRHEPMPRPAARNQITDLIATLLDEEPLSTSWQRAFFLERACTLDTTRSLSQGTLSFSGPLAAPAAPWWSWPFSKFIDPMLELDALRMMQAHGQLAEVGLARNYPLALTMLPPAPGVGSSYIEKTVSTISRIMMPSLTRSAVLHFRTLALRRMAAIALAIRLFELDRGNRPASLDELVPGYLATVPLDPFAADDRTIGYLPEADPPRLYSIGDDGMDDTGEFVMDSMGRINPNGPDTIYFLDGDRPQAPLRLSQPPIDSSEANPTADSSNVLPIGGLLKAVEDDRDERGGEGNAD